MSAASPNDPLAALATRAAVSESALGGEVLAHLDEQLDSARRLLGLILNQGAAIRERKVDAVLASVAEIKAEMELRGRLEETRGVLLARAGSALGVEPAGVTLEGITRLMGPDEAGEARSRSSELRGLLGEIAREHGINRALMRQELAFLDHLVRMIGAEPEAGYRPDGATEPSNGQQQRAAHRVLDLQA